MKGFGLRRLALCALVVGLSNLASAQEKVKFGYDVSATVRFDNREYGSGTDVSSSKTLFGIRPDIALGFSYKDGKASHKLLGGASVLYEFGGGFTVQPLLYYHMSTHINKTKFELVAGAFPRSMDKAGYTSAIFSSGYRFYDNTLEGMQFSTTSRHSYYELGVDWRGQLRDASPATHEEFVLYSGGRQSFAAIPFLKVGYYAYLQHYAYSTLVRDIIDNALLYPYVEADFGYFVNMQTLSLRVGYLQSFQRDRDISHDFMTPKRGQIYLCARKWNIGVESDWYFGEDMMPLYETLDPEGNPYHKAFYMGDTLQRVSGGGARGYYYRAAVFYNPHITDKLDLKFHVNFDFNNGYQGSQWIIQTVYRF